MKTLHILSFFLILGLSSIASAQTDQLSSYIKTCPLITDTQRSQALQALERDSASLKERQSYTIETSKLSSFSIKLLPLLNGTPLVLVIETVDKPIKDSSLHSYSPNWQKLSKLKLFDQEPTRSLILERWGATGEYIDQRLEQLLYPLYLEMSWVEGEKDLLSIRPVLPLTLSDREHEMLMSTAERRPQLLYRWNGSLLVLQPAVGEQKD
ncbi:MAG: DUF3256 family protein [Porphyromonadaceae bacterium]|nr:DUF3256 family protein [Porphyromonadaceae bacterium]